MQIVVLNHPDSVSPGAAVLIQTILHEKGVKAVIERGPYGKPEIVSPKGICANGSHSGHITVAAISDHDVGIDVQACVEDKDFIQLAKRFMHKSEAHMLKELPEPERKEAFYRLWVQKESYQKYRGLGFHLPMKAFYIKEEKGEWQVYEKGRKQPVYLKEVSVPEGYVCWLCTLKKGNETWKQCVRTHLKRD